MSRLWAERRQVFLTPQALGGFKAMKELTVVLSNHFVRYAVIPALDGAASREEELALARFHFARVHGERVKGWEVRLSPGTRLACAVDAALVEGLKACASVQPFLMWAFNRWRRRIPRSGAWLVLREPERVCVGMVAGNDWRSVCNTHFADHLEIIERERRRAAGEALPELVLIQEAIA